MTERAITAAVAGALEEEVEAEQLGLFGEPQTAEGMANALAKGRKGPGRPGGARNKRTERSVAFLLSRHRDPREVLLEIAEANVFDLAALLKCKPFEAMQEKRLAAIGVLPYVAARITPEVIDNRQVIHLHLAPLGAGAEAAGGERVEVLGPDDYQVIAEEPSAATPGEPTPDEA